MKPAFAKATARPAFAKATARQAVWPLLLVLAIGAVGCGKRGSPMAPIRPVPGRVTQLAARRVGDKVEIHFNVPLDNSDQSSPPVVGKVEIYGTPGPPIFDTLPPASIPSTPFAIPNASEVPVLLTNTTAMLISRFAPVQLSDPPGYVKPALTSKNKVPTTAQAIVTKKYLRGSVEVRPAPEPPKEGAATPDAAPAGPPPDPAAPPAADDPRPLPGWRTTFIDQIPTERERALKGTDLSIMRYVVVGVSRSKRRGATSPVLELPMGSELNAPADPKVAYSATAVTVTWTPGAPAQVFRIYKTTPDGKEDSVPLNAGPLTTPTFSLPLSPVPAPDATPPATPPAKAEFDEESCFTIRAVLVRGNATIESEPAGPICVTPQDTFPPTAPSGLSGLPTENQIQLIWSPTEARDLAGYLVMRSEGGAEAKALMDAPITDTSYTDATGRPGGRYSYTVVAVDKAGNKSPASNPVEWIR